MSVPDSKLSDYYLTEDIESLRKRFTFGVSVDCVIFGYQKGSLRVLLIQRGAEPFKGDWALPGDLVNPDLDIASAANVVLTNLTGLGNIYMEQFYSFGSVDRHPAGRVVTTAYFSLVKSDQYHPAASSWAKNTQWFGIDELPPLAFDHETILKKGLDSLQKKVRHEPVGFELLPRKFTLRDLQEVYEAILNCKFDKPNFRKKILSTNLLIPLNEYQANVSHRPAKLFKFDEERYQVLREQGLVFDI